MVLSIMNCITLPKELLLASNNLGKYKEFQQFFHTIKLTPVSQYNLTFPAENGLSFVENALNKARFAAEKLQKPALADDSGLVVPALNGQPGIHSARFAGANTTDDKNIKKLLTLMKDLHGAERQAYYYCALVIINSANDPTPMISMARWDGEIAENPSGIYGFGYDPIFYLPKFKCTAAQLPLTMKNSLSHRAKAIAKILSES